jgi:LDH2 family malate/lactate/ureidoglycolate dehydrogenase
MALYPKSDTDRRVMPDALEKVVDDIFRACGMSEADAGLLTESLVHADVHGVHSHGVLRIPDYVKKLTQDGVDPRGRPRVVSDRGAALVIDGGNSMGQIGGAFAMEKAIDRAAEIGVAFAAVGGSNHCGAMDWYTLMAVRRGMIGIAGTNAIPTMAPWGGLDRIVGINPLSIAFPADRAQPVVLDFAFGATAHGKIRVYHQKGSPIPSSWAFDEDGHPTTDAGKALTGLIQPIGQHKGVALGMAIGMLSTLLSGAGYGTESGTMETGAVVGHDGHFFAAIDIAAFQDLKTVERRVDSIVNQVHGSRRMPGVQRLLVPGEIESEIERDYRLNGILLSGPTVDDIAAAAASLGVDASPLFG